jgi:hypothetical protein
MPWDYLLGGAGIAGFALVLGLLLAKKLIDSSVETGAKRIQSVFAQAEESHRVQLALGSTVDLDLRQRRTEAYADLWRLTELLPEWPREDTVTYEKLELFSRNLRTWYFRKGGMYLSHTARERYGAVQKEIAQVLKHHGTSNQRIVEDDYEAVRQRCSEMRTALTDDLISRRAAPQIEAGKTRGG